MRESRFVRIAKLAYHIAQQTLPTYSHPKSRHDYTFPQRVACVMLKIYLNYTYRDLEEWLLATDQVRQALHSPVCLTTPPSTAPLPNFPNSSGSSSTTRCCSIRK